MLVIFSHLLALSVLFTAAVYDLRTTEVPDWVSVIGVLGGLLLHAGASYATGSLEPLIWSLGVGAMFSVFGWGMYYAGMWGGADAFATSVLGFAAPYSIAGPGLMHPVNLFVNLMMAGFIYTLLYAFYRAARSGEVFSETYRRVLENEKRIGLQVLLAGLFSAALMVGLKINGFVYFAAITAMIFLYQFLKVVESNQMRTTVPVSELEEGDVIDRELDIGIGAVRERNMVGAVLDRTAEHWPVSPGRRLLRRAEHRYGYSEIVGVTSEEIQRLEENGVEEVEIRYGVMFVPVFPVALAVTDLFGGGLGLLVLLFSL